MAQQIINIGAAPNDGTGDQLRTAFDKVNSNDSEIYQAGPVGSNLQLLVNTISSTDTNGDILISPNGIGEIQLVKNVVASVDLSVTGVISTNSLEVLTVTTMKHLTIDGSTAAQLILNDGTDTKLTIDAQTGNIDTQGTLTVSLSATLNNQLDVIGDTLLTGTLGVGGLTTLSSAVVSDLVQSEIVLPGLAGVLGGDANFTFDGTELAIGGGTPTFTVQHLTGNTAIAGTLTLAGAPAVDLEAATKLYVDTEVANIPANADKVNVAGDTMTGALILAADPTVALHAATMQYVDAVVAADVGAVALAGDTMTGPLILDADPTVALHAATMQYVDAVTAADVGAVPVGTVPATAKGVTGDTAGDIAYDAGFIYVCTATWVDGVPDIWARAAIATWV